jgi:hypothetical protein
MHEILRKCNLKEEIVINPLTAVKILTIKRRTNTDPWPAKREIMYLGGASIIDQSRPTYVVSPKL